MNYIEFANSSAISKISFDHENDEIGVAFTANPDKYYYFQCEDLNEFIEKLQETVNEQKSLGKFISEMRKDGTLVSI
jgi:uncharacterized tellurite resistance protein B-like protein